MIVNRRHVVGGRAAVVSGIPQTLIRAQGTRGASGRDWVAMGAWVASEAAGGPM
jgi:hypothetical protein